MKLDVKSFAMTCALVWGLGLFLLTWWIILFQGSAPPEGEPPFIGLVYLGYRLTPLGSVIGLAWAFVDGWIGGAVFAWLYNVLASRRATA
jgi:hypothetical protein